MADNEEIKRQSWRQIPFVSAMSVRKEKKKAIFWESMSPPSGDWLRAQKRSVFQVSALDMTELGAFLGFVSWLIWDTLTPGGADNSVILMAFIFRKSRCILSGWTVVMNGDGFVFYECVHVLVWVVGELVSYGITVTRGDGCFELTLNEICIEIVTEHIPWDILNKYVWFF